MKTIDELQRRPSPASRPQPLAFAGGTLWMGAWDTQRLYAIEPQTWTVGREIPLPGKPFGMTARGGELRVVIGVDDDDRYIYRIVPDRGVDPADRIACPELTGSQLAFDGDTLVLSQLGNKRMLWLDGDGNIRREIALPRKPCGMVFSDDAFHLLTGDDEMDEVRLTRVVVRDRAPEITDLAGVPFDARGLAFDGTRFWTSDREKNEIVAFSS